MRFVRPQRPAVTCAIHYLMLERGRYIAGSRCSESLLSKPRWYVYLISTLKYVSATQRGPFQAHLEKVFTFSPFPQRTAPVRQLLHSFTLVSPKCQIPGSRVWRTIPHQSWAKILTQFSCSRLPMVNQRMLIKTMQHDSLLQNTLPSDIVGFFV